MAVRAYVPTVRSSMWFVSGMLACGFVLSFGGGFRCCFVCCVCVSHALVGYAGCFTSCCNVGKSL